MKIVRIDNQLINLDMMTRIEGRYLYLADGDPVRLAEKNMKMIMDIVCNDELCPIKDLLAEQDKPKRGRKRKGDIDG